MARPKQYVDEELLKKLAEIHCSWDEISSIVGVSRQTIERRYGRVYRQARDNGKMSLRRKRFEIALSGNVPMLIWLSKQMLGEKDKVDHGVSEETKPIASSLIADLTAQLSQLLNERGNIGSEDRIVTYEPLTAPNGLLK